MGYGTDPLALAVRAPGDTFFHVLNGGDAFCGADLGLDGDEDEEVAIELRSADHVEATERCVRCFR